MALKVAFLERLQLHRVAFCVYISFLLIKKKKVAFNIHVLNNVKYHIKFNYWERKTNSKSERY